jgi:hypothetical protein
MLYILVVYSSRLFIKFALKSLHNNGRRLLLEFPRRNITLNKTFQENDINAVGFDGNPYTLILTNNLCQVLDLSVPKKFDESFDWVLSLEVGEHLPQEFEDIFIHNLHNNNKNGIVLSWAIKGQGGHGHFNEQNNDYIKSKICRLGYINDTLAENILRKDSTLFWFKNTIMVFRKQVM